MPRRRDWTRLVAAPYGSPNFNIPRGSDIATVWERFTDVFGARLSCIDDVAVELVRDVDEGDARYLVGGATIEIEIPTNPPRFRESLAHELAHHVEHTCAAFDELRDVLHPVLGGPVRPWAGGDVWADSPSERWAETVVELVNGERVRHVDEVAIDPAVRELVGRWVDGAPVGG